MIFLQSRCRRSQKVKLFKHDNFRGRKWVVTQNVNNFCFNNMNDEVSSIVVKAM